MVCSYKQLMELLATILQIQMLVGLVHTIIQIQIIISFIGQVGKCNSIPKSTTFRELHSKCPEQSHKLFPTSFTSFVFVTESAFLLFYWLHEWVLQDGRSWNDNHTQVTKTRQNSLTNTASAACLHNVPHILMRTLVHGKNRWSREEMSKHLHICCIYAHINQ